MSLVSLSSGGLDSTLMALLAKEQRLLQFPLFIDYGQRAAAREWQACQRVYKRPGLPAPTRLPLGGFGKLIETGLTSQRKRVVKDAFTPGRNLMFLLLGAAYAAQKKAKAVSIGLLDEKFALFPDQRYEFIVSAEKALQAAMGTPIRVVAPLMSFRKADVIAMATTKGIIGTYSCHMGLAKPCGRCISCREFKT
jgi:7-cyano-7-deazaguanine synthase